MSNYKESLNQDDKRRFKIRELEVQFNLKRDNDNFCNGLCDVTKSEIKEGFNSDGCVETFQGGFTNNENFCSNY